jgi:hypothetical protein
VSIINVDSEKDLKTYTVYAPSHHKDGIILATKEEDGQTMEVYK